MDKIISALELKSMRHKTTFEDTLEDKIVENIKKLKSQKVLSFCIGREKLELQS